MLRSRPQLLGVRDDGELTVDVEGRFVVAADGEVARAKWMASYRTIRPSTDWAAVAVALGMENWEPPVA
jgi:hypothetical protein